MLLTFIVPIADARRLQFSPAPDLLTRPAWPLPGEGEYVRGYGAVRRRPRGGVPGWGGESLVCDARRALVFEGLGRHVQVGGGERAAVVCAFRRFFFDGSAVAKFEIGFGIREPRHCGPSPSSVPAAGVASQYPVVSTQVASSIGEQLLQTTVLVRQGGRVAASALFECGGELALSHARASTRTQASPGKDDRYVLHCAPAVILEHAENLDLEASPQTLSSELVGQGLALRHSWVNVPRGGRIAMWRIGFLPWANRNLVRDLRVCISRTHVERQVYAAIVRGLAQGLIAPASGSEASDRLQLFIKSSLRRLRKLFKFEGRTVGSDAREIATRLHAEQYAGEADALLSSLKAAATAATFRRNIEQLLLSSIKRNSKVEVIMGDQIHAGHNSVINSRSTLTNVTQIVGAAPGLDDQQRDELSKQIELLRTTLTQIESTHAEEAQLIARRLEDLTIEAAKEPSRRKRSMLDITAKGLVDAAEAVASFLPELLAITSTISQFVSGLAAS